ncbi:MAG TPA: divalent metal cation transporter [Gemmatimonadaceae bacterium]|nr:divalent metal cation transporter [Gemmatimonadaceae bacterium]
MAALDTAARRARNTARLTARAAVESPRRTARTVRRFWGALGPGLITGAADDDPSGIATYSVAGAHFGTAFLWTALITWPLMAAVQTMCARIGMVTGKGLMGALEEKFPRPLLAAACLALFVANTLNLGSDLAAMADAAELLTHVSSHAWVIVFALVIGWATVRLRYAAVANTLKWLALVLFAYVVAAFAIGPHWGSVLRAAVTPVVPRGATAGDGPWATLVAILGTTISPYLFFWQASQEVEEQKALGRHTLVARRGATPEELRWRKVDVGTGTLVSNLVMFFIILTTALTLHAHGVARLETSRDVAEALRPLAGRFATLLYTVGLLGTGALAIPTLAGSAAYAFAEVFGWEQGIDEHFRGAPAFYAVILLSLALGVGMDFANVNAVQALYWTAVLNGLLAPFLLVGILVAASDRRLMHGQPSSRLGRTVVAATTAAMFAAAIGMFVL